MRCRKHPADATSGAGVCASCLRECLSAFAVAQAQAQRDRRRPDAEPDVPFPRSVSPYLSRRKSDASAAVCRTHGRRQRFHSACQVGADEDRRSKRVGFTSLLFGIFRSKSERTGPVPGLAPICDPIVPIDSSCSVPSPSWFSADFFTGRRDKNVGTSSIDGNKGGSRPRRTRGNRDRGMSPARHSGNEDRGGPSGYSSESSGTDADRGENAGAGAAERRESGGGTLQRRFGVEVLSQPSGSGQPEPLLEPERPAAGDCGCRGIEGSGAGEAAPFRDDVVLQESIS